MRRRLLVFGALLLAPAVALVPAVALADIPSNVATYESHVYGTGVHVIGYTDAYPNWSTGAVDNHYPLAKGRQDGSPLSDAVATYSDVGPAAMTVAACTNSDPSQCPQNAGAIYATAHYPGGPATGHVDSCTTSAAAKQQANPCPNGSPSSYADTAAGELSAAASGYYAGGGTQPFSGAAADSRTTVKADGSLVVTSHSSVHNASFGPVNISKVDVLVVATSAAGAATATATVTVGSVTVNGQPVNVTDSGTTFTQQQVVPCPGGAVPAPVPTLPAGLPTGAPQANGNCVPQVQTETIKVFTVAPQKKVDGNHATVSASGLHVQVTQPSAGGAPSQRVEYVLGEGYADAVLTPASPQAAAPPPDGGSDGAKTDMGGDAGTVVGSSGTSDFGSGDFGGAENMGGDAPGGSDIAPAAAVNPSALFVAANRRPLVYMFLLWESIVMAAAAAWVWTRRLRARTMLADLAR